ncbi:hypothetical protein SAMN04515648_3888 [Phyllobacterium sp. CL33Tsu]|uniref:hypothetical protein n=1 Tax=Phyllobacterium sp. CL33Tsu TaxID=1798191 RepID=UPI0008E41F26|nr:hypothetical protein [Phyllobacterium sp. CL33Tsu]SFJ40842.1 hypothetical protein SAMN04515648_3888 [Phyllobacterium sp. CL33Tsu]
MTATKVDMLKSAIAMRQISLALAISCLSVSALAEAPSFAKLQAMCGNVKDPLDHGYCVGFLEAVALRIVHDNKHCTVLQEYIDHPNSSLAFPDLIADVDPKEYSGSALEGVEKYFLNKGCM